MVIPRYSQQPERIAQARDFLVAASGRPDGQLPTYEEVATAVGSMGGGLSIVPVLNSVAIACLHRDEPDLSVLVVNGQTRAPGAVLGEAYDPSNPTHVAAWTRELAAVREYAWPAPGAPLPWRPPKIGGGEFPGRRAVKAVWGGDEVGGMARFPGDPDRYLNIFSDDDGDYPDRRVPGSDRIEYVGQGLSGDQRLNLRGNALTEESREQVRACRYWYRPAGGLFTFERWVVIVARHREWNRGKDQQWRRAYVYDLAPIGGPDPATWPRDVLTEAQAKTTDDTLPAHPPDASAAANGGPSLQDLYRELARRAGGGRARAAGVRTAKEYARSSWARDAVLLRAEGACENPRCAGMPCDVRPDGEAILDVDHVQDLALEGKDESWNMVALCPNCHASKTRGKDKETLRRQLAKIARTKHAALTT